MLHGVTRETTENTQVVVFELPGPDGANFYCNGIIIVINTILPSGENKMKSLILFGLLILSSVAVAQDAGEDDAEGENW